MKDKRGLRSIIASKRPIAGVLLGVALLVLSIKPFLFTWNFIQAVFHLERNPSKAGPYLAGTLACKPAAYKIFNENSPLAVERYLVKSAVYKKDRSLLDNPPGGMDISTVYLKFKDNFYLQDLLGNIGKERDWENLDEVSFALLTDREMNPATIEIIEKIGGSLDPGFIGNLVDFLSWKQNSQLCRYLASRYLPEGRPFRSEGLKSRDVEESAARLEAVLDEKYKLKPDEMGDNLVRCPGFADYGQVKTYWYFSKMAGKTVFSRGSFFTGLDRSGINPVMRVMGFFVSTEPGKSKPRAGVRYRGRFPAENGFYVFSFDYCTATGKERPSFFLANGLPERPLPPTGQKWQKVIFVLNNSANTYNQLNPLVRMWGTGTLLVDNVFLAKVITPTFSVPGPYVLFVEGINHE
jgi:hypothetical protein